MKTTLQKIKTRNLQNIASAEKIDEEIDRLIASLEGIPKLQISYKEIEPGILRVSWPEELSSLKGFDIHYYNTNEDVARPHRLWQLNIRMHVREDVMQRSLDRGYHDIPMKVRGTWRIQGRAEDYESSVLEYTYTAEDEEIPSPPPTVPKPGEGVQSVIHYIDKPGDPLGTIVGVIDEGDKVKVYVNQRNGDNLLEFESTSGDLTEWKANGETSFPHRTFLFQPDGGRLHGWWTEGDNVYLRLGSRLQNDLGLAYNWKVDGAISMHQAPGGYYRAFGRVRGNNQPRSRGGWGGDLPPYPEGAFQDRRGISYHHSTAWEKGWTRNRILADPADYFEGYHKKDVDLVPDFYNSVFRPDGRGFVNIFWKRKSREVDRRIMDPSIPENRRYRLAGELYPVPAIYANQKVTIFPDKEVIPRHLFEQPPMPDLPTTLPPGKKQLGEINLTQILVRGDKVHTFHKWRRGIHYEGHGMGDSGFYMHTFTEEEFDALYTGRSVTP